MTLQYRPFSVTKCIPNPGVNALCLRIMVSFPLADVLPATHSSVLTAIALACIFYDYLPTLSV